MITNMTMETRQFSFGVEGGVGIFRNQPSYKFFNKSFNDPADAVFLTLNEINPNFLSDEQLGSTVFESQIMIDPRNRQPITQFCIDNTKRQPPKIFKSYQHRSKLSKEQHVVCLRVLLALQNREEVLEKDLLLFRHTAERREKEKVEFFKFVNEFSQSQRECIYGPVKRFKMLYSEWYRNKTNLLITLKNNVSFNTYTGLPHVNACSKNEHNIEMSDVQVEQRKGYVPVWNKEEKDLQILFRSIETFSTLALKTEEKLEDRISVDITSLQNVNEFSFIIPFEALLFLMTAGDYIDLPTEIMLDIQNDENEKRISFHTMLPARNCGWHTNTQVVEQAFQAFQSVSPKTKWLHFDKKCAKLVLQSIENNEIAAGLGCTERAYHPLLIDDYLQNLPTVMKNSDNKLKCCQSLVQWKLKDTKTTENVQIYTILAQPSYVEEDTKEYQCGFSIKLEYKPQFGCEVMTKYELLKEWLTLRLLASNGNEAILQRLRVSAAKLETLMIERLTCSQIEHELSTVYSISVSSLLSGLFEFLKLLQSIQTGQYMLRFNAKFRDKLMLCAPSKEITQNTIFLHNLVETEPSDLPFMTQHNFLPIANDLCSAAHLYHKVLPCAFKPYCRRSDEATKQQPRSTSKFKVLSDREYILSRLKKKSIASNAKSKELEKKRQRLKKARRRNRLKAAKQAELAKQQDEEELRKEIELDKILFGLS